MTSKAKQMLSILSARSTRSAPLSTDLGLLLLRVWFGTVLALNHGLSKVSEPAAFAASVAKRGIPLPELSSWFAALSEFAGGLLLAAGLFTRLAALGVVPTMMVAAFFVHANDPFIKKEFALAYAVAAACIFVTGPGRFSVDAWLAAAARKR